MDLQPLVHSEKHCTTSDRCRKKFPHPNPTKTRPQRQRHHLG